MAGKIIEIIILLAGLLITAAIVVKIPLDSYNEYKDYLAQIEEQNEANKQAAIKPKVESLTVELKEGVRYFANDLADPKVEHFTVVANYVKGEEKYSEPVEEGKFDISVPADFYSKGGEIKISFKGASATVKVELEPVVVETIELVSNPYTVKYAAGSTFNADGMVVKAIYNDGSTKTLSAEDYAVDTTTALTTSDKEVTVTYGSGESAKTVKVAISVDETVNDGAVVSISIADKAIVNAGDVLTNTNMTVIATYESGNKKALSAEDYTISASADAVKFGKAYELTVSYNADTTKTAKVDVIVRQTIQGEDGTIVGGAKKTETEYVVIDGVITETENSVSFAGSFSQSVLNGKEASLTLTLNSASATVGNITMRCGNSYCCFANGVNKDGGYIMMPLQINTILDLTINGREVQVPATVVLKGCGPDPEYAPLFGIYYEFTFEDVQLDPGVNVIKFNFKKSTVGASNCWGESPSTLNIDYVHFDSLGSEIPDNYEIEGLEIGEGFKPEFKQNIDSVVLPVTAVITGGTKIGIESDLYEVKIVSGNTEGGYFHFGTYTIEVSLKSNPSVKVTKEYTVEVFESFAVLTAGVELVDGKVYYVFTGTSTGYTADDFVFFDGSTKYKLLTSFGEDTFTFKIDVTELAVGTIYPHLEVGGVYYVNGKNSNGDIRDNGLTFTNGQSVRLGNKIYTIKTEYSMPTLVISEASPYQAVKDNSFESSKTLLGTYVWGSEGVTTTGNASQSKPAEYTNGIGGMDKANTSVTYTFTVSADGKVDFIWNIAGNQWKSGVPNLGITDMADHMTITIDGKAVDISGIGLPAGSGSDAEIWWNMQQLVIKDVVLTAGEHTFKCVILADGAGLNAGAMEIYYAAN